MVIPIFGLHLLKAAVWSGLVIQKILPPFSWKKNVKKEEKCDEMLLLSYTTMMEWPPPPPKGSLARIPRVNVRAELVGAQEKNTHTVQIHRGGGCEAENEWKSVPFFLPVPFQHSTQQPAPARTEEATPLFCYFYRINMGEKSIFQLLGSELMCAVSPGSAAERKHQTCATQWVSKLDDLGSGGRENTSKELPPYFFYECPSARIF